VQEWLLEPGDMLYLPPGWAHDGLAVGGDCMTASVGFRAPQSDELAQALLARLADSPPAARRAQRYRDPAQPATAAPGVVPEPLQRFARQALAKALADPLLLERTLGEWLTEPKAQVWFEARAGQNVQGGVQLDRRTRMAYDARHVYINGESHRASGRDAHLMRTLADDCRLEATAVGSASQDARTLLGEWLADGWLQALR
jgi:50S ribosomal protein L16 3-hydroxylase